MLYDRFMGIAVPDEYKALAIGAIVVAAVLIWSWTRIRKQMRTIEARLSRIESQLSKMKNEIDAVLQIQTSLIMRLNAYSGARLDPSNAAIEMGISAAPTISPPAVAAQPAPASQQMPSH
jgi:DNA anti-recombination protein RmuC